MFPFEVLHPKFRGALFMRESGVNGSARTFKELLKGHFGRYSHASDDRVYEVTHCSNGFNPASVRNQTSNLDLFLAGHKMKRKNQSGK
jgi:hypothetical protein